MSSVVSRRPVLSEALPALLALAGCLGALGLLAWLPTHLPSEHDPGPRLQVGEPTWWLVAAVLVAQAAVVVVAARFPARALLLLTVMPLLLVLWPVPVMTLYTLTAVAQLTGVFVAATAAPLARLAVPLTAAALLLAGGQYLNGVRSGNPVTPSAVAAAVGQAVVVMGLPLLLGALVAARRALEESHRRQLDALRREQEARLTAAVSGQRIAMSRELHDIAAHHLSGIILLAAAIGRQVDEDPSAAKASAFQVREQSRSVLADLRRLVGLLREDADADRPVETIDAVTALVEGRRRAGAEIDLTLAGPVAQRAVQVGPLGQVVVHRMVQESLSNAARHAPGARCSVEVDARGSDRLVVEVRNIAPAAAHAPDTHAPDAHAREMHAHSDGVSWGRTTSLGRSGGGRFGLLGMAERAQLVGGELSYGPTEAGGWLVRLTVPFDDVSPAPPGRREEAPVAAEVLR